MTYPPLDPALPVVAVDFDGVLAESTWPSARIGRPIGAGFALVRHYAAQGAEVVILTARPQSHWTRIREWLVEHDLDHLVYDVTNVKMPACLYFDDRAWRFPL